MALLSSQASKIVTHRATAGNGLLANLVGYWGLDEAAGANNALDKHSGALTLTQNGSPGSDTGKVYAGARTFTGSAQYFARASETALQVGGQDFTIAAWVYLAETNQHYIAGKGPNGGKIEYELLVTNSVVSAQFYKSAYRAAVANTFGALTFNTWYLAVMTYAYSTRTLSVGVNNVFDSITTAAGDTPESLTGVLRVGGTGNQNAALWKGRLGPVAMWKSAAGGGGCLSAEKLTALYNGGNGLAYAAYTA